MAGNAAFLKAEATQAWLGQFDPADQPVACNLLRAMTLVSRDAFFERLRQLILARLSEGSEPVGLYAERELGHRHGVPHRLFKETETKVRRASGSGPQPVKPTKAYNPDVGSEGLVAHIISELCRENPKRFYSHPGPDEIRRSQIRRFMLITDFIGSGTRVHNYLQAAWKVRSVRSWWSARAQKGLSFEVIAYSAAPEGKSHVEGHPAQPTVHLVTSCPTLQTVGRPQNRLAMMDLCKKYSPVGVSVFDPLGFGRGGALIAFAHGVPNNTPAILHKKSARWTPLFRARVTSSARGNFPSEDDQEDIRGRLVELGHTRLAAAKWLLQAKPHARKLLLAMAALNRSPRSAEAISGRTGLTIMQVDEALARALTYGWIDGKNVLTNSGHAELDRARKRQISSTKLAVEENTYYCPTSLRAPS